MWRGWNKGCGHCVGIQSSTSPVTERRIARPGMFSFELTNWTKPVVKHSGQLFWATASVLGEVSRISFFLIKAMKSGMKCDQKSVLFITALRISGVVWLLHYITIKLHFIAHTLRPKPHPWMCNGCSLRGKVFCTETIWVIINIVFISLTALALN